MEFSLINIVKVIVVFTGILIAISVLLIFRKRQRKNGVWMLSIISLLLASAALYYYIPRKFDRNYLSEASPGYDYQPFRRYADSLKFFIGATGDTKTIKDPEFYTNFNSITPARELKMGSLLKNNKVGEYDFSHADSIIDISLEKNLRIRGHVLVWGKLSSMFKSPDLDAYLDQFPKENRSKILWDLIENHITTVLNHYKGKIYTWDVVNEPLAILGSGEFDNNLYYRYLGEEYIERAFKLANKVDPGLKLYLNEYFLSYKDKRTESFYNLVKKLKENGVPIHGIGIQGHIPSSDMSFVDFNKFIQRITGLGLEVEITELDARLILFKSAEDPYVAQGEYYGKMLWSCLNNPLCKGITFWGFSDKESWYDDMPLFFPKPNEPYLFDAKMNPKPSFYELLRIFRETYDKRKSFQ
jgi:endo-1,4-beta-xylanase